MLAPACFVSAPPDRLTGGSLGALSLTLTCSHRRPRTSRYSLES